jgi:hypothetical protein
LVSCGRPMKEIGRKHSFSNASFYIWRSKYGGMDVSEAIGLMVTEHRMSERHACALVGLSRDTYRHVGKTSALNVELRDQIIQTAHASRRWGYRMIHDVLRPRYPDINHKRVHRIYTA